jgi:hypothetical protein
MKRLTVLLLSLFLSTSSVFTYDKTERQTHEYKTVFERAKPSPWYAFAVTLTGPIAWTFAAGFLAYQLLKEYQLWPAKKTAKAAPPSEPEVKKVPAEISPPTKELIQDDHATLDRLSKESSSAGDGSVPKEFLAQRKQGLSQLLDDRVHVYQKLYPLSQAWQKTAHHYGLSPHLYGQFSGVPLQHTIHEECIGVTERIDTTRPCVSNDVAIDMVEIARQANTYGFIEKSINALNVGWALVNHLSAGVIQGTNQTVIAWKDFIIDPYGYTKEHMKSAYTLARSMYRFMQDHPWQLEQAPDWHDESFIIKPHPIYQHIACECARYIKDHPGDVVRETTAVAIRLHLDKKSMQALHKFFKGIIDSWPAVWQEMQACIPKTKREHAHAYAGPPLIGMHQQAQKARERLRLAGSTALGLVQKVSPAEAQALLDAYMQETIQDIEKFRHLFDSTRKGFAQFAHKYFKVDFKHVMGIKTWFNKKGEFEWTGFHHDYLGQLERIGAIIVTNKRMGPYGFYIADITINGTTYTNQSFFPQNWTRQKIAEKIFEAYEHFLAHEASKFVNSTLEKYPLLAKIQEGIEIEMIVSSAGKAITVSPLLKGL